MFLHNSRGLIIIAAVVAICGLAVAGFMHRGNSSPDANAFAPQVLQPAGAAPYYSQQNAPQAYPAQASSISQPGYASDGYYSTAQRPVYVRQAYSEPIAPGYVEDREYVDGPQYTAGPRRERVYRETTTYHRGRSKAHSVEIVAGTAAVGAAIGAIAGGGKGAAIGALSGGGAGFAYDRLTHNH